MRRHHYELVIEAGRTECHYWRDLWRYREPFYFLAWRDILVRYKQTAIGAAWALLRPLLIMLALTVVFGKFAKLPSDGIPYPMLVLVGVLPWFFFARAVSDAGNSLLEDARLISKLYFPTLVVPASATIVVLVDLLISCAILAGMMACYGVVPDLRIFALPFFVVLCIAAALGAGHWIAALNVKYRDFRYAQASRLTGRTFPA
jgi:homopolymeric O-antigen transport system permease protein